MRLIFADEAWEDYCHWQTHDAPIFERINRLLSAIQREPFTGIGKPEALTHALTGFWSRRTSHDQRVVYRVDGDSVFIAQLRIHC